MKSKIAIIAALTLAGGLLVGPAMAGGIPHPGKGHGHSKHYSYGHGAGHRYERRYDHGRYYGHGRGHQRSYGHYRSRGHYRGPGRVVRYSRYEVHRHGPYCGHSGYTRSWSRSYSPYYRHHQGYGYGRDYGRASFSGYDDGVGYYIQFDY